MVLVLAGCALSLQRTSTPASTQHCDAVPCMTPQAKPTTVAVRQATTEWGLLLSTTYLSSISAAALAS